MSSPSLKPFCKSLFITSRHSPFPYRANEALRAPLTTRCAIPGGGSFLGMRAGVRVKKLVGDVGQDGGAPRRDAASGDQSEERCEKLAEIDGGRELGELGEEVGGEVFRIVVQLQGSGGFGHAEMVRTKAEVRLRASEAAALPVGVAIQATSGIVEGDAGRFRENGGAGFVLG